METDADPDAIASAHSEAETGTAAASEAEERFRLAFEHAPIGIALVSPEGRFMRVNEALSELTGYSATELIEKTFQEITHPDDLDLDLEFLRQMLAGQRRSYEMEKRYFHRSGQVVWALLSVSLVRDPKGEPLYFISQIQDITERKQLQERLAFLADHDEMTGLANRRRFREELARGISYARRYGHCSAMLLLDLDNFKQVNDTLGHHIGDKLVVAVSQRLKQRLRSTDVLARIGGDEFGVFLPQSQPGQAERVAKGLLAEISEQPYEIEGHEVSAQASLGVARFDGEAGGDIDPDALLMQADLAMYRAKNAGGNDLVVVDVAAEPQPAGER
jgi:diguanylate cyclase (GGDEF)-like protein/PAS domain S-box-containing protein